MTKESSEAKNIFAEASLPFFLTQPMLRGVKCTCLIYSRPILLFSLDFSLFDNVSAIRFTLSLVKYHNCLLQPIDTNRTWGQDMLIHPSFMLSCMLLLIKYQCPEETDESQPLFKVNHKRKFFLYSLRDTVVHHVALGHDDERTLLVFLLLHCSFYPLQVLSVLC